MDTTLERFNKYYEAVTESGCWLWTGGLDKDGYGVFWKDLTTARAHRSSYELLKGTIPDGLQVLHSCDIPSCVNPDHLFLGTHNDNMKDKSSKNRQTKLCGSQVYNAKLTENDVVIIKQLLTKSTLRQSDIAGIFNICEGSISQINRGIAWKHVT